MNTRSRSQIYLVGTESSQILGSKLPSAKQVLSVFFYNRNIAKMTIKRSAHLAVQEASLFWLKANIPIRGEHRSVEKLLNINNEWMLICKNKNRRSPGQTKREEEFVEKLDDLFDIAHGNALEMINDATDKQFLISQRQKGRSGSMAGVNMKAIKKEKRKAERCEVEECRNKKIKQNLQSQNELVDSQDLSFDSDDGNISEGNTHSETDSDCFLPSGSDAMKSNGKKHILTRRVIAAFDKYKVSDRGAMHIMVAILKTLNISVDDYILNRSTLQLERKKVRKERAAEIKSNLKIEYGVVHWDGKLLPDITGKEIDDRLPVFISHENGEQLLGVPKIESATGEGMADAVHELLTDWNLLEQAKAFCCDTTAPNTGRFKGAAKLLEAKLEKEMLYLPCRHHIYELVLRAVFESKFPVTTSKDVPLFKRFQSNWNLIDKSKYRNVFHFENDKLTKTLQGVKDDMTSFCNKELQKPICRADYKELLQLTKVALGTSSTVAFRTPGPTHHARWMSKAIYCLKIYLFREEFTLTSSEEEKLRDICAFIIRFYVKAWFKCPIAPEAAYQDFSFLQEVYNYRSTDQAISEAAVGKICNHLWYLADECIGLAYFDEKIPIETKIRMVEKLKQFISIDDEDEQDNISKKRISLKPEGVPEFLSKSLEDFVTNNTLDFFRRFNISKEFLYIQPDKWKQCDDYEKALKLVHSLRPVNDTAERGVKLFEEFNKVLTNDEHDKQYLIQVVADYKNRFVK